MHLDTKLIDGMHVVHRDGQPTNYYLAKGRFRHAPDDRLGSWYVSRVSDDFTDKRGMGFTKVRALEEVFFQLELEARS